MLRSYKEIEEELEHLRTCSLFGSLEGYKRVNAIEKELNNLIDRDSLRERRSIEDSIPFGRSTEKTQVMVPQNGLAEIVKNRATHSYDVTTSSLSIGSFLAYEHNVSLNDIDYMRSLHNVSLLHDVGHSAFGHVGSEVLSRYFKALGLKEGFDDNNNNLVIVEKNKMFVRDYTLASIIKYPHKLYESQKEKYLPILAKAIEKDLAHYKSIGINLERQALTIACQIMDEADRNSYTCSDLTDYLCVGSQFEPAKVIEIADKYNVGKRIHSLLEVANDGSKNDVKKYFSDLKESFNFNHTLSSKGIGFIDPELFRMRELLSKLCKEFYIEPLRKMDFHADNMNKLKTFANEVVKNDFHPSNHYRDKIKNATNKHDRLVALRDMVCEVSDWYVINTCKEFDLSSAKNKEFNSELKA